MAEVMPLGDPTEVVEVDGGGDIQQYPAISPAVQLSAVIIAQDALGVPIATVPLPAYERPVEAIGDSEVTVALDPQVELLNSTGWPKR